MEEAKSAESRVNMVSLFDFGLWMGGTESNILELGRGYEELTEDWAPNTSSVTYVNMETAANTLNGYDFSMTPERQYISDEAQKYIDKAFRTFPTGSKAAWISYNAIKTTETHGKINVEFYKCKKIWWILEKQLRKIIFQNILLWNERVRRVR